MKLRVPPLRRLPPRSTGRTISSGPLTAWVTAVGSAAEAVAVVTADGLVAAASAAAVELLGARLAQVIGVPLLAGPVQQLDFGSGRPTQAGAACADPVRQALNADTLARALVRIRRADARVLTLDVISAPLHAPDGHTVIGAVTFLRPV